MSDELEWSWSGIPHLANGVGVELELGFVLSRWSWSGVGVELELTMNGVGVELEWTMNGVGVELEWAYDLQLRLNSLRCSNSPSKSTIIDRETSILEAVVDDQYFTR